jgi:septum formation topological specificity factor MinE
MEQAELIRARLKSVMTADRLGGAERLLRILRSDLTELLKNYMELAPDPDALEVSLAGDVNGFELIVKAKAVGLIDVGKTVE